MAAFSDAVLILATLGGPILAVQAQTFLERRRASTARRLNVFRTVMATRGARLSAAHVEALNLIDIEFYTPAQRFLRQSPKFRRVRSAWRSYYAHLESPFPKEEAQVAVYLNQRNELFTDLVYEMAIAVGYAEFDKDEIRKVSYVPQLHENIESEQTVIRKGFSEIFSGKAALPLKIVEFPFAVPLTPSPTPTPSAKAASTTT
jgi:hypothetical protein